MNDVDFHEQSAERCERHNCSQRPTVVKYAVSGMNDTVHLWLCAECADDPYGRPQQAGSWHRVHDLREGGVTVTAADDLPTVADKYGERTSDQSDSEESA